MQDWKEHSLALQDRRLKAGAFVCSVEAVLYCRKCKETLKLKSCLKLLSMYCYTTYNTSANFPHSFLM